MANVERMLSRDATIVTGMETLGRLVKRLREERKLTQGQVAEYAGVSRSWIALVESEKRKKPERDILEQVARVLHVHPNVLLSAAGYRVAPLPPPEPFGVEDLLRQAQVQFEKVRPVVVPLVTQRAAAGYLSGATTESETFGYLPETQYRKHDLLAIRVSGTCLEPRLWDGHTAIIDKDAEPREGDIVLALHEGEAILKELRAINGIPHLVALQGQSPIPVNGETRIVGVVIDAKYRP